MLITKRSKFPQCIRQFMELKGICVGECCVQDGDRAPFCSPTGIQSIAHAHARYFEPFMGWICLKREEVLKDEPTLLHEVAHLIACKLPWIQLTDRVQKDS